MPKMIHMAVLFYLFAFMNTMFVSMPVMAEYKIKIRPMIVVGEAYDDNINLDNQDEKSDFITTVSPGLRINIESKKTGLSIDYFPTWVRYHKFDENDTVRQNLSLSGWHHLTRQLKLNLDERYTESEEPLEAGLEPGTQRQVVRTTRNTYKRNSANAGVDYQFGRENDFRVGYSHEFLENDDPDLDDSSVHGPFTRLTYWFTKHNGVDLIYRFSNIDYERENGPAFNDDIDGQEGDARFTHRLGPHTNVFAGYGLAYRNFKGEDENYRIHDGRLGVEHDFSSRTSLSLEAGLYKPKGNILESQDMGWLFGAYLKEKLKHGEMFFGLRRDWDEGFLEAEARGFTEFWGADAGIQYDLQKELHAEGRIAYRKNDFPFDDFADDETYIGHLSIRRDFLRWYSLGLYYTYSNRKSNDPESEFVDNIVMMTFRASRTFDMDYPSKTAVGKEP